MSSRRKKVILGVAGGFAVLAAIGALTSPSDKKKESSDSAVTSSVTDISETSTSLEVVATTDGGQDAEQSTTSVTSTTVKPTTTTIEVTPATAKATTTTAKPTTTTAKATTTTAKATTTTVKVTTTTVKATASTTNLNIAGGNSPEDFLMPNVLCMNLQAAQDEIQDHGVFFSRSVDATGQGRMQILDSNWIVVGQKPAVGTKIGEGDAVLSVVKIGESTRGTC